jgi:hypothetical protein
MRLAARSTVIAGALVTAAIASPVASARLNLEPTTTTGQTQTTVTAPAVVPNPDQQITHVSAVGPPILQSATQPQQAELHRIQTAAAQAFAYKPPASARYSPAALNGYVSSPTNRAPAVVHVTTHDNPFDWGAAAIGAAGGLATSLLIIGGGIVVTQRRQPKANRAKALA